MKKYKELITKSFGTFTILMIFILGQAIPVPGYEINFRIGTGNSFENLLALTSGGVFNSPTLFSLGMGPYMTVSILLSVIIFSNRDRMSSLSQEKRGKIQVWATFIFAFLQSIPLTFNLRATILPSMQSVPKLTMFSITVLFFVVGGMLISWLASINTDYGIGGPFVMILPGIISGVTQSLSANYSSVLVHTGRLIILIAITVIFMFIMTAIYSAEYRIDVQRINIDRRSNDAYLAFRIIISGAMPLMFATSFMYLPSYIMQLTHKVSPTILSYFDLKDIKGICVYGLIIYVLGFLFSLINVMPDQIAKDLKESNDYILGINPGKSTKKYIEHRVLFLALTGSLILAVVVTLPLFISIWTGNPRFATFSNYFAMLFVLIAIFDTLRQDIDFLYYMNNYNLLGQKQEKGAS